jgi:hypothetical protein
MASGQKKMHCKAGVDLRKKINWPNRASKIFELAPSNSTGPRNIGPQSGPI